MPTKTTLKSTPPLTFPFPSFPITRLDVLDQPTLSWCINLLLCDYLLKTFLVSKVFTLLIITLHTPPTTSNPIHHSKIWRWSTSCKKNESCYFNLTLISSIFIKASATISTAPYLGGLSSLGHNKLTLSSSNPMILSSPHLIMSKLPISSSPSWRRSSYSTTSWTSYSKPQNFISQLI